MKKVVMIFDGGQYSKGGLEFCQRINDWEPVLLIGCFLPGIDFTGMSEIYGYGALDVPVHIRVDEDVVDRNITLFEGFCNQHQLEYRVHKDLTLDAYPVLRKESRFADLLVIGSQGYLGNLMLNIPSENLRDSLHEAECPVVVVPSHYREPAQVVLAYDGSRSSAYAIKMFSYIFPDLCKKTTILIHIGNDENMPATPLIRQLGNAHFPDFQVLVLEKMELFENWIKALSSPIMVTGGFGRSGLSSLFKTSFAGEAISSFTYPVFIAHV